jgi:hypothetical protein
MQESLCRSPARKWLDRAWWAWLLLVLVYVFNYYRSGDLCRYSATDFRGYYASAQIAWQHGFARVYHQPTQDEFQAKLPLRCPDGSLAEPPLRVTMPYLPAFVILLLPLPAVEFSSSYWIWALFNLAGLALYSWRFCHALAGTVSGLRLFQWLICLPLLATLSLGQMNVFLVICLGEFTLAFTQGRELSGGLWLSGMLLKPHTLILYLPGLVLGRRWKPLAGFLGGFGLILAGSYLLAGAQGLRGMLLMVGDFASPAFETASTMMNWRSLALNLSAHTPSGLAWGIAVMGIILVAGLCLALWRHPPSSMPGSSNPRLVILVLATYAATCSIAWHSHFYMLLLMIPFLVYLDGQNRVPTAIFALWVWGPPLLYLLLAWVAPGLARSGLGMGMLGLNLIIFAWLHSLLRNERDPAQLSGWLS